ncbi:MAG: tryptophan--tRNA ligase [Candidatus Absconditabacterales bacterium]|nr:tryptophan--tRNA ligase [Candidatus Absconditabacterales bacterium]
MKILTGFKPTADQLHIGNYLGAMKPLMNLATAHPHASINLFVASMHAYTYDSMHTPGAINANTLTFLKLFVASGADLSRYLIYDQWHIPEHTQLTRTLTCLSHMGMLERMHAYKDAVAKGKANEISVGVFLYPVLMAADILLYDATHIPVGQDQKQHVELARDLAIKVNNIYGDVCVIPEPIIGTEIGTIPGIDGRKMSKSHNNFLGLLDDEETLRSKIKKISTDMKTVDEPKDPDTCNVYAIIKHFLTSDEQENLTKRYRAGGLSYKELKDYAFETLWKTIKPIQDAYHAMDDSTILKVVHQGTEQAREYAQKKIRHINAAMGYHT